MIDNYLYMIQTATVEQLKNEMDKNLFVDEDLKDFTKGKEILDSLFELNSSNISGSVKDTLILYGMYKLKGGK